MKSFFSFPFVLFFSFFGFVALGQDKANNKPTLQIEISGVEEIKGSFRIAVFNSADNYEKGGNNTVAQEEIKVTSNPQIVKISGVAFGKYAIKIYQDLDNNKKLDKNSFGAPEEPYGFSNNAKAIFSAPDFEDAVFSFDTPNQLIKIKLED